MFVSTIVLTLSSLKLVHLPHLMPIYRYWMSLNVSLHLGQCKFYDIFIIGPPCYREFQTIIMKDESYWKHSMFFYWPYWYLWLVYCGPCLNLLYSLTNTSPASPLNPVLVKVWSTHLQKHMSETKQVYPVLGIPCTTLRPVTRINFSGWRKMFSYGLKLLVLCLLSKKMCQGQTLKIYNRVLKDGSHVESNCVPHVDHVKMI